MCAWVQRSDHAIRSVTHRYHPADQRTHIHQASPAGVLREGGQVQPGERRCQQQPGCGVGPAEAGMLAHVPGQHRGPDGQEHIAVKAGKACERMLAIFSLAAVAGAHAPLPR